MKVKDLILHLQAEDPELNVELTKVLSFSKIDGEPVTVSLDFPIIGTATKREDLYLIIEAALEMIAFGKDIKRFDGKLVTRADAEG